MDYQKIVLELLQRIESLEERVNTLESNIKISDKEKPRDLLNKVTTGDVIKFIIDKRIKAFQSGEKYVVLRAGTIADNMGISNKIPVIVNAMKKTMDKKDKIISVTHGYSVDFEVKYFSEIEVDRKRENKKGKINTFKIKKEVAEENKEWVAEINGKLKEEYLLVYDQDECVGVVEEHYEKRGSEANGQAEISFFAQYSFDYGRLHLMVEGEQKDGERITYKHLKDKLNEGEELRYDAFIKEPTRKEILNTIEWLEKPDNKKILDANSFGDLYLKWMNENRADISVLVFVLREADII